MKWPSGFGGDLREAANYKRSLALGVSRRPKAVAMLGLLGGYICVIWVEIHSE
jgi:hypothetical protein